MVQVQASRVCVSMAQGQADQAYWMERTLPFFLALIVLPRSQMPLFSSLVKDETASKLTLCTVMAWLWTLMPNGFLSSQILALE